ncbi:MAG TPA: cyclic pyranopterin monophosphate synthase MoaC [Polyangiales bacterium]
MASPKRPALTHLDERGRARMVDVGEKPISERMAVAQAKVHMQRATLDAVLSGKTPKGDVLAVARVAGIQAAKRTWELIPMCHQLQLSSVKIALEPRGDAIAIEATVRAKDRTGVEMEALTAASIAALTLYDMLKAIDRAIVIDQVKLLEKRGGKSGDYVATDGERLRSAEVSSERSPRPSSRKSTKASR